MKKLRSSRGETLTETLVSVFVIAVSAAILATMTAVSSGMDAKAALAASAFYQELDAAERAEGSLSASATLGGALEAGDMRNNRVAVLITGNDGELRSYRTEVQP